jgi:hypothetical protein
MVKWASINDWLINEEDVLSSPLDPAAGQPPADVNPPGMPGAGAGAPPADQPAFPDPMSAKAPPLEPAGMEQDPDSPDMPEDSQTKVNFDSWRNNFFRDLIKGDVNELLEKIQSVRNGELDSYQRKFVEDNLQILFLRQNANIEKASKEIRKKIREELDRNNPSVSLINHVTSVLQSMPELTNVFIKLLGLFSNKSDLHRKYIASLLGAAQVGSGGQNEDLILNQKEFSIKISTRMASKFGTIDLGRWSMIKDDQEQYLSESELERLEDGSPDEREVLRKRVVLESIASYFRKRAYFVNIVDTDGTVFYVGLDLSNALREAYDAGKLVIKTKVNDSSEAMYTSEGELVEFLDIKIMYEKDTGKTDADGKPLKNEIEFITRKDGMLLLNASLETIKDCSATFQGILIKESPFTGNPSDLQSLMRCVPSAPEMILRSC